MKEKGFIFDYAKCVGCHACIIACYAENKTTPPLSFRQVKTANPKKVPLSGFINLSIACNHCKDYPCSKACPSGAYSQDKTTGAIIHNPTRCIGCKYCTWICPFDAPRYNAHKGIVEKCNFCNQRLLEGDIPACAKLCPTGALSFGDIDIKPTPDLPGFETVNVFPRMNLKRAEVMNSVPEMDMSCNQIQDNLFNDKIKRSSFDPLVLAEWPLVLFSFITAFITGWFLSSQFNSSLFDNKLIFFSLALIGFLLSLFHLGKPFRALNSFINLKSSWLSREVFTYSLFIATSFIYLFVIKTDIFAYSALALGILCLISLELVYSKIKLIDRIYVHSANSLLTALLFAFVIGNQIDFFILILCTKAILFFYSKENLTAIMERSIQKSLRVVLGFMIPIYLIFIEKTGFILLIFLIVGELIDRFNYYEKIVIESNSKLNLIKN